MRKDWSGKVGIDRDQYTSVVQTVNDMTRGYYNALKSSPEQIYARAVLNAFDPQVKGARVPSITHQETSTMNTFVSKTFSIAPDATGPVVFIGNHTAGASEIGFIIKPVTAQPSTNVIKTVPINANVALTYDHVTSELGGRVNVNMVIICTDITKFTDVVEPVATSYDGTMMSRARLVSSTVRTFKISNNENESGTLNVAY